MSDADDILAALREWVDALNAQDLSRLSACCADDVALTQPLQFAVAGHEGVRRLYRAVFAALEVTCRLQAAEIGCRADSDLDIAT